MALVAVSALPCKLPTILELKVFVPAKVCAPVVTTPLTEALALGIVTAVPLTPLTVVVKVGPELVPLVHELDTLLIILAVPNESPAPFFIVKVLFAELIL